MSRDNLTKQAFMRALLALCGRHDFSQITVAMIAQEVGMHRQTFYYHFQDKYDLLAYTYQEISFHFLDQDQVNLENWREQTEKMLKSIVQHRHFYLNTATNGQNTLMLTFSQVVRARLEDMLQDLDPEQSLSDYDRTFYAEFFGYGCGGVLLDWIVGNFKTRPTEIGQKLSKLIVDLKHYAPDL